MYKMLRKTVIAIIMIMIMIQTVYAYQFRDYRWGSPMVEIEKDLKSNYELVSRVDDRTIVIFDRVIEEPAQLDFIFTPKTKKLCAIIITFEKGANQIIKNFLTKEYGKPIKTKKSIKKAIWMDSVSGIQLKDDYTYLKLIYMHIDLYNLYEKERAKKERA